MCEVVQDKNSDVGRYWQVQRLVSHGKDLGFYPEGSEKSLMGFEQDSDINRLTCCKENSGNLGKNELEGKLGDQLCVILLGGDDGISLHSSVSSTEEGT